MSELFADGEFVRTIDAQKLMKGLFYFAADMQNVGLGISFYDLFTTDELYGLNVYDNYKYYVIRGPSPLNRRFPQYYAKALLEDFLMRADRAVEGFGRPAVRPRRQPDDVRVAAAVRGVRRRGERS